MSNLWLAAIAAGTLIVIVMAGYAGVLLYRLYLQSQAQRKREIWLKERSDNILHSIRILATAMVQEELNLSEGAIRVCQLLKALPGAGESTAQRYPALFELYQEVKSHPRGEARQELARQERMRLDWQRMRREAELAEGILSDARQLQAVELHQLVH